METLAGTILEVWGCRKSDIEAREDVAGEAGAL
jgi:hypothetical protein